MIRECSKSGGMLGGKREGRCQVLCGFKFEVRGIPGPGRRGGQLASEALCQVLRARVLSESCRMYA